MSFDRYFAVCIATLLLLACAPAQHAVTTPVGAEAELEAVVVGESAQWRLLDAAGWIHDDGELDPLARGPAISGTGGTFTDRGNGAEIAWDLRHPEHHEHSAAELPENVIIALDGAAMCRLSARGLAPVASVVFTGEWTEDQLTCLEPGWLHGALDVRNVLDGDTLEALLERSAGVVSLAVAGVRERHMHRIAAMSGLTSLYLADRTPQVAYHGNPNPPAATQISDAAFSQLATLTSLRSLHIVSIPVDAARLDHVAQLEALEQLVVRHGLRPGVDVRLLAGLTQLRVLELSGGPRFDDAALEGLRGLVHLEVLRPLGGVSDVGLRHLGGFHQLRLLELGEQAVTDAGLAHLAELHSLRRISLIRTPVTAAGLAHLGDNPSLRDIRLQDTAIGDDAMRVVAGWPRLESLGLAGTAVTDDGLRALSALTRMNAIDLENTQVGDAGLAYLSGLTSLRQLNLTRTQVRGPGLAALVPLASRLEKLTLGETRVTDEALSSIEQLAGLGWLDVSGTQLTDTGLSRLSALRSLEWVFVRDTAITEGAVDALRAQLPQARIYSN